MPFFMWKTLDQSYSTYFLPLTPLEWWQSFDFFFYSLRADYKRPFWKKKWAEYDYLWDFLPQCSCPCCTNPIITALCFAIFKALISGLVQVKRPRQLEKACMLQRGDLFSCHFNPILLFSPLFVDRERKKKKTRIKKGHTLEDIVRT